MMYGSINHTPSGRRKKQRKVKGETYQKYKAPEFQPLERPLYTHRSSADQYPSADMGRSQTPRVDPRAYSGERKLLGVAAMHKSNLVPVFDENDAKEIARMRR